jgi:hypothetical protein
MGMPLVMLGSDYSRQHIRFGAVDTNDPYWYEGARAAGMTTEQALAQSGSKPGSDEWWRVLGGLASKGLDVVQDYLNASNKVASTPAERAAVQQAAAQQGITLSQATPYLIGGGALLVVVILLMSRKRR